MIHLLLPLIKNPITQMVASKTIGAIQHKLDKDKIIRAKEIEHVRDREVQQIVSSEKSWKDEWITVVFTLILLLHFIPQTQDTMDKGWEILKNANDYFWIAILAIISGSFGLNVLSKFKGKK